MLSRAKIKFVHALTRKKDRAEAGVFIAEGTKLVGDLLASRIEIAELFALPEWLETHRKMLPATIDVQEVTPAELKRLSALVTPHEVLALARIPKHRFDAGRLAGQLVLGVDGIQDPGNLGSILRLCDWFGVSDVLVSPDSVDCFNPKVVQATMGSIARVRVHALELVAAAESLRQAGMTVFGASLDGVDVFGETLPKSALLLLGNESRGLRPEILALCDKRIAIPSFGQRADRAESLNVAIAAGILCAEFRRHAAANDSIADRGRRR
jgi:TrmH family RNA methyltransferase